MKKIIISILVILFICSSMAIAQEMTTDEIIQELSEIASIENDIQRLEAYDQFVAELDIDSGQEVTPDSTNNIIAQYSGSGTQSTRPFTVNSPWEIQWSASGEIFQIYLYDNNGNLINVAANQMGAGSGSFYSPKTGSFYLEVNAMGSWEIEVVDVD